MSYLKYSPFLKKKFGVKVQKVSIDAGFTCPNQDDTKGVGGCTYFNNNSFNPKYCKPKKSITFTSLAEKRIKERNIFQGKSYY